MKLHRKTLLATLALTLLAYALPAQTVSWSKHSQSAARTSEIHADLNHDGREDFVFSLSPGFYVQLSTGGGTYAVPSGYEVPNSTAVTSIAVGSFISTGADIATTANSPNIWIYHDNGRGVFSLAATIPAPDDVGSIVAGDFNHDGHMDLAYGTPNQQIHVLFGPVVNGTMTQGPVTDVADVARMYVGDFDGDGRADIVATGLSGDAVAHVYYGDGTGHFPTQVAVGSASPRAIVRPFDVNGDGRSDLIGAAFDFDNAGGFTGLNSVAVYYGTAARTFSPALIATSRCVPVDTQDAVTVGDFNGDGVPDVVYEEVSTCNSGAPHYLAMRTGSGGGGFNAESALYTSSGTLFDPETVRASLSNKPALDFSNCTSSDCSTFNTQAIHSWLNATAGAFPSCAPPAQFTGMTVCSPGAGTTVSSPVSFSASAVTQTPARKMELWVDGHKVSEQLTLAFSKYAFLDKSISLAAGTHKITVIAAGWDNWVEKKSFSITVN